ncbi:MAG: PDZ domain-containing protein [Pirellulaceae bacterium]
MPTVSESSPAERAGLVPNQRIAKLNRVKIQDTAQLDVLLRRYLAADRIQIRLKRDAEDVRRDVAL